MASNLFLSHALTSEFVNQRSRSWSHEGNTLQEIIHHESNRMGFPTIHVPTITFFILSSRGRAVYFLWEMNPRSNTFRGTLFMWINSVYSLEWPLWHHTTYIQGHVYGGANGHASYGKIGLIIPKISYFLTCANAASHRHVTYDTPPQADHCCGGELTRDDPMGYYTSLFYTGPRGFH
ncbi:hypothetical protein BDM02DRAFT_1401279 [Thelephora ganbajun]|uniref:Uncharacterized protein n=1 Tax=Thelephora ganbajun TaxID=370292 RepID=A0ACB6ZLU6_THEGA|nr:hypothetical protein BDM02DRAFT_1401279 [Thelephora ganbajun]